MRVHDRRGGHLLNLHGMLGTAPGAGLAGRGVTLYYRSPGMNAFESLPAVATGVDGTCACQFEELPHWGTPVLYLYNGSQSPSTHR